jgi:uncharacterized membrane protein YdjX (TVP38/TMEM64 family)
MSGPTASPHPVAGGAGRAGPNANAKGGDSARIAGWVRLISLALIVVGLVMIATVLPVERGIRAVVGWVDGLGPVGPLVFAGIYLLITVLMIPAAAFSVAAGALFGPFWGTVSVWLGSNLGAAAAFLIARYLARDAVEKKLAGSPKFKAIDRAVAEGGWKIVAMLRLSPAVPFNVQNYLYGLTSIRFWACVAATAVAMLPGIFLYVYLGYAGRVSIEAAAAGEIERGWGYWTLLAGGLIATVAVTVYITRLAWRAVAEQTDVAPAEEDKGPAMEQAQPAARRNPWVGAGISAVLALLVLIGAALAMLQPEFITRLFGPPAVTMAEAYEQRPDGPTVDHSRFQNILDAFVNEAGGVDYAGLAENPDELLAYNASLADVPWSELGRNEKLALLLNAYNSFTLELMIDWLDEPGIEGIRDIPRAQRWDAERWNIGGNIWSLDQIEHVQIRAHFIEPDYHFAAVCAAIGCPPLRTEVYTGERLDEQLRDQARIVHEDGTRWFQYDRDRGVLHLTPLYQWYRGDFEQVKPDILQYAAQYNATLAADLEAGNRPNVRWLEYDWSLNDQEALPEE